MGLGYLQSGPSRLNRQESIQLLRAAGVCLGFNGQISPVPAANVGESRRRKHRDFFWLVNDDELMMFNDGYIMVNNG